MGRDDQRRVTIVPPPLNAPSEPEEVVVEAPPAATLADAAAPSERPAEEPPAPPAPEPPSEASWQAPDPFAAAREALARARAVRGVGEDPVGPVDLADPMAAAHAALERAREARREREPTPERRLADALATAELRRLQRTLNEDDASE